MRQFFFFFCEKSGTNVFYWFPINSINHHLLGYCYYIPLKEGIKLPWKWNQFVWNNILGEFPTILTLNPFKGSALATAESLAYFTSLGFIHFTCNLHLFGQNALNVTLYLVLLLPFWFFSYFLTSSVYFHSGTNWRSGSLITRKDNSNNTRFCYFACPGAEGQACKQRTIQPELPSGTRLLIPPLCVSFPPFLALDPLNSSHSLSLFFFSLSVSAWSLCRCTLPPPFNTHNKFIVIPFCSLFTSVHGQAQDDIHITFFGSKIILHFLLLNGNKIPFIVRHLNGSLSLVILFSHWLSCLSHFQIPDPVHSEVTACCVQNGFLLSTLAIMLKYQLMLTTKTILLPRFATSL